MIIINISASFLELSGIKEIIYFYIIELFMLSQKAFDFCVYHICSSQWRTKGKSCIGLPSAGMMLMIPRYIQTDT